MDRRLAVSDIHGEGHRLLQVLEKAHYEPGNDRLFLLGDYGDRGTDSRFTVEAVRRLIEEGAGKVKALLGNHDEWWVEAASNPDAVPHWLTQGGDTTLRDYGGFPPADVVAWLRSLDLYHEEPDCILVHAGLMPGIPLQEQDPHDLLWIRKVFHNGYRGKRVIFGHTPTWLLHGARNNFDIWRGPDKIGIDTGAAYGGPLTLLDLDSGETWTA